MSNPTPLSLDQLQVLLTVAEVGSFAGAARRLKRATSAVSYAIDTLEAQLGLSLFDRGTTRRPKLTQAGEAIVSEARSVAYSAQMLRSRVQGLLAGLEAGLSIAVDVLFPSDRLVALLQSFHIKFPTVPLRVNIEAMGGVERLLRAGTADIGIGGVLHMSGEGLQRIELEGVRLIPVAASDHPLAIASRAKLGASREHLQLVLTEREPSSGRDFGVVSLKVWRLADLATKHALLLAGVGWGGMPEPMVRADLDAGRLAHLQLPDWRGGEYPLQVVHKTDTPPGPAGDWLIGYLSNQDIRVG